MALSLSLYLVTCAFPKKTISTELKYFFLETSPHLSSRRRRHRRGRRRHRRGCRRRLNICHHHSWFN